MVLQEMNKLEGSSPRCVRCPKIKILVEMCRANLQTQTFLYVTQRRHNFEIQKICWFPNEGRFKAGKL